MLIDAMGTAHCSVLAQDARIVSLVPSLTELLFALGLGDSVVGRTGFCIHPAAQVAKVPKVGGTKDVQLEKIRALAPTHVLLNIDENERPTAEKLAQIVPHSIVTHPLTARDNLQLYQLLGAIFSVRGQADLLCQQFECAWQQLAAARPQRPQKVLYCIWKEPWMTIGGDTYIANMLGLINWQAWCPAAPGGNPRYPVFDWDDAALGEVDQVLLSTEPYRFNAAHVQELQQKLGKPVQLLDGEMLSWYGSRAIAGLAYLQQLAQRG